MNIRTDILPWQAAAVEKLLPIKVGALFMDMGTGKTRTAIEFAVRRACRIDKVVWFTLVSLKETVRYEIKKHTSDGDSDIYLFDHKTNDENIPDAKWYVIGLESISGSSRITVAANRVITHKSLVIVDESSYIKGHLAKRTQRVTMMAERAPYRLILTGTPISQGVQDLYSQMRFLSPKILGYASWYSFEKNHLEYHKKYPGMIVRTHNTEWLSAKIAPYVYQVTKDECLDLPPKLNEHLHYSLSDEQWDAYNEAKDEFAESLSELDDEVPGIAIFRLFNKLQSIVCGYIREHNGLRPLTHGRLEILRTALDAIPPMEPIIIWTKYHFCRDEIAESLQGRSLSQYHGKISEKQRHIELENWRNQGGILLATQDAGGHGLDLTNARYVIFYANGFKYSSRIQAEDRCHRIGQTRSVTYIDLWGLCGIEDRIRDAIRNKRNVVETFKNHVNACREDRDSLAELMETL